MKPIVQYFAEFIYYTPRALLESYKLMGLKGVYLVFCAWLFRCMPFPLINTPAGRIASRYEALNFIDNFVLKELRCLEVEKILQTEAAPIVVDLGVNVGITIRWWMNLSPQLKVIGVDMHQEALDYTTSRLTESECLRWIPICGAVGAQKEEMVIYFEDPLEGNSSLNSRSGSHNKKVIVQQLDTWLENTVLDQITLLKIDIEGFGGKALLGAKAVLAKTQYVVLETHDDAEQIIAAQCLISTGFYPLKFYGRSIWWKKNLN